MHTVSCIDDIQLTKKNERVYEVQLTLIDDSNLQMTALTQRMREEIHATEWHRMSQLMLQVVDFNGAEQLCMELFKDTSDETNRRYNKQYFKIDETRMRRMRCLELRASVSDAVRVM